MPYKIDRFNFDDQTVENFNKVGITPDKIEGWIADGRKNGITDEGIRDFMVDQYNELNAPNVRGRNKWGALRVTLDSVLPFGSGWADEAEATFRSKIWDPKGLNLSYDDYYKNAKESREAMQKAFDENAQKGNWATRHILGNAPMIGKVANEGILAAATGGATLMPGVQFAQGAIEGFGSGEGTTNRLINAGLEGGLRYGLSSLFNKVFPTKEVSERTVDKAAKGALVGSSRPMANVIAKSIKTGTEPVAVIAKESTRGTEPAIMKGLQQALKGNDAQATVIYDSALKNVDYEGGFIKYIKDRMPSNLSDTVKNRLSKGFSALENSFESAANNTDDVLVKENLPQMIDSVINFAMRGAENTERKAVKDAAIKAFSERHFAKEIAKKLIPQNMIGQLGNQISMISPQRMITRPLSNAWNAGTLRTMTNTLPRTDIFGKKAGDFITNKIIRPVVTTETRPALDAIIKSLGY